MAINVGDLVRITDRTENYAQWGYMLRQMGFRNDAERDSPYNDGDVLKVFAKKSHPTSEGLTLYGLQHPTTRMSTQVLMNSNGIEYVFPGNWHIKVTAENDEMLGNWRESGSIEGMEGIILSEYHESRGYWVPDEGGIPDHCQIEITTEQFIQYVLNQPATNMPQTPTPEPTTNLENEQEDAVVTTTEKVICITDKWNYVNLGEVYEVVKRDEYYTYVKDSVGGESRYAHHYFEDWVDADTKARRDSFKALFGDHSMPMFKSASDDVQKLMSDLYPKLYEYKGWIKLKKETNHDSHYVFEGVGMRLISENDTTNERLHGTLRFDPDHISHEVIYNNGYAFLRFRHNR